MGRYLIGPLLVVGLCLAGCASDPLVRSGGKITVAPLEDQTARDFTIPREEFLAALERGPSWLIQNVTVRPVLMDRQFYGFQLVSLFPDQPERRLPIQVGDIVQQVNGQSIERPDQFMSAWESLSATDVLSIRVVRDGRPLMINWLIASEAPQDAILSYGQPSAR